jgi:hypothetical protein
LGGFEPPTSCSTDRRSNQLSYNCTKNAAEKGCCRAGNYEQAGALARRQINAFLKQPPYQKGPADSRA